MLTKINTKETSTNEMKSRNDMTIPNKDIYEVINTESS